MASPAVLGFEPSEATSSYIVGPLVISFSITAIWEVNRSARLLNIPAGLWLALSPLFLDLGDAALYNSVAGGLAIVVFSVPKGKIEGRYGGGWASLFSRKPVHDPEVEVKINR